MPTPNKTKTPRTDIAYAHMRISALLAEYRSDDKARWEPAYDALVFMFNERNKFELETIQLRLKLEEALAKRDSSQCSADARKEHVQELIKERNQLTHQLAELQEDKERLDWLDNAWQGLTIDYEPRQYQKFLLIHIMTKEILGMGNTLRQAIDAARKKK